MEITMTDQTVNREDMFYIVCQEDQPSRHGGYITEIKMINLTTGLEFHTYVDENNRNYKYWHDIVNHPLSGFVVNNLKKKRETLISADSKPRIQKYVEDQRELESVIVEYLDTTVYARTNPLFNFKEN